MKLKALRPHKRLIAAAAFVVGSASGPPLVTPVMAQSQGPPSPPVASGQRSADDVARELANPNTALGSLSFPIDYINYGGNLEGAGQQRGFRISVQPSLPVPLGPGVNFFARPLVPIIVRQPVVSADGFEAKGVELGDLGFDSAVGKTFKSGVILIGGLVRSIPTATADALGLGHWTLGPEAAVGLFKKRFVLFLLVTQSWNVGGDATNVTAGQYAYTINVKNGWQIAASPTYSYNHEAESGNRLSLPVPVGVNKTIVRGKTPWKFSVQYWYFAWRPETFGPRHQVRFTVTPVVPLPW